VRWVTLARVWPQVQRGAAAALAGAVFMVMPNYIANGANGHGSQACAVAYMPQRSTWVREVRIDWDQKAIRRLRIDGVEPYGFSLIPRGVMTAVDNERIQIDLATRQWQSDFRGHASGQGRCETAPG
jgi:hypothetical protein